MSVALATKPDMNREEAVATCETIRRGLEDIRYLVLELHDRRGWSALGYESWRSCVVAEFGRSESHLYRQLQAALIERDISPTGETRIPERQLRPLAAVPQAERADTWQEAVATAPGGKVTADHVQEVVDRRIQKPARAKAPISPTGETEQPAEISPTGETRTGGQCRLNGVLVPDPPDIAELRSAGRIGADVVPEITDPVESDEPETDPEPDMGHDDLSDDEWLDMLPLRQQLAGSCLKVFDSDALAYRQLAKARDHFKNVAARVLKRAHRKGGYAYRVRRFLGTDHPSRWVLCPDVDNGGCGGVGTIVLGECPKCRGRGYWIK